MSPPTVIRRENSVCSSLAWSRWPSGCAGVGAAVALLLDAHDVAGAPMRGQQVGAVVGREEVAQRLDLGEQADQIVLLGRRRTRR